MEKLTPPKHWLDKHRPAVIEGLKKAHPDWDDKKCEEMANTTLGNTWYHEMDAKKKKEIVDEKKEPVKKSMFSGVSFGGRQKAHYEGRNIESLRWDPAILAEFYDENGKFEKFVIVTFPEMLKEIGRYDTQCLALMIHSLTENGNVRNSEAVEKFATEIRQREVKAEEARKRAAEASGQRIEGEKPSEPSNWELKRKYLMGKSVMNLALPE
jgi:hypothetical protein